MQGRNWRVGRVGNCPPSFWQNRRSRQPAAARHNMPHYWLPTQYLVASYAPVLVYTYIPIIKKQISPFSIHMYLFWHILVHFERVWQCLGTRLSKCFMVILVGNNSGKVAVAWKEVKKVGHEQHRQLWAKRRACRRVAYERALPMRLKAPRDRRTACAAFSAKICIKYRKHGCYSSMLVNFLVRTHSGILVWN